MMSKQWRHLLGSTCIAGCLVMSATPVYALNGVDQVLKEAVENVENYTRKIIPRIGFGGAFVYGWLKSAATSNPTPGSIGTIIGLGYMGFETFYEKAHSATLDDPACLEFLTSDEAVSGLQQPKYSQPSIVSSKSRD